MGKHILIVDDDKEILESTCSILKKRGFEISCAENGKQALEILYKNPPDLILTDVLMPEMDGFAMFKEIKKAYETSPIPVVVISGRGQMKDSFGAVGVDQFITKPFTPQDLLAAIEQALQSKSGAQKPKPFKFISKILIVGRPGFNVLLHQMVMIAEQHGVKAKIALSVSQAAASAIDDVPDLVFTDVQLDKPVVELVRILRQIPEFGLRPIVGFSYYETEQLDDPAQRDKILKIERDAQDFSDMDKTVYIGRWIEQEFIELCANQFKM